MQLKNFSNVRSWLVDPLSSDVEASLVRLAKATDVVRIAVMPDVHLSHDVCVGVALATANLIYPAAVGGDIGCGMLALRFQADDSILQHEAAAAQLLAGLYRRVPSLKHLARTSIVMLPTALMESPLSHPALEKLETRDAPLQLGTLGRGNHFVEFQADDEGRMWVMLHSGSRGIGQAITSHHLRIAANNSPRGRLQSLDSGSSEGRAYLADQQWARDYAAANRLCILESITVLLRQQFRIEPDRDSLIHSDHNHVRREIHDGVPLWIHRKGAQSAAAGEPGIIPGSMGTTSHHVIGRGNSESLCSSSHGAGRVMSRTEAASRISVADLRRELQNVWIDSSRLADFKDEAPAAYRDIREVMNAQKSLCKSVRALRPLLNYKR